MLYRVSLTGKHNQFSVPQLGYLGYRTDSNWSSSGVVAGSSPAATSIFSKSPVWSSVQPDSYDRIAAFQCIHLELKCAVPWVPSYFGREVMADIQRLDARQAHTRAKSNQALLVCAYEDEAKCRVLNLDGSISLASFKSRVESLTKSQEIVFY